MTIGQRIAQKRKEQGLSQEGLGEQLGVSRQAIYKWESDASLPEIDKLITLSKIFSVPVGWLLGVEEDLPESLDQDQERLVEDILSRYQAALPKLRRSVRDWWPVLVLSGVCAVMLIALVVMGFKLGDLSNSITGITHYVNYQINSITGRMQAALEEQTNLISAQSIDLVSADFRTNTATFSVEVTPKTCTEGMTALFSARNGLETVEVPAEAGPGYTFSGEITCPLTDRIFLSVSFLSEGTSQTQQLTQYFDLYTRSGLRPSLSGLRISPDYKDHTVPPKELTAFVGLSEGELHLGPSEDLQVGLFRDRKLVQWFEPDVRSPGVNGIAADPPEPYPCWTNPREIPLEDGVYCLAAVYTDESGRQRVYYQEAFSYIQSADPAMSHSGQVFPDDLPIDPGNTDYWEF